VGNISSSHLQIDSEGLSAINDLACDVVNCALNGRPAPVNSHSFSLLKSIAGPVFSVKNLVHSLVNDLAEGATDLFNPSNSVQSGTFKDVYEVGKILKILKSLE
jgi:hypothetical protein